MKRAGRTKPKFTKAAPPISIEDYFSQIKRVVPIHRRICFFVGACHLGTFFTEANDVFSTKGHASFTLPSLILALKATIDSYPIFDEPKSQFESCIDPAKDLYEYAEGIDFDSKFSSEFPNFEDALRMILWITSSNHQYQGDMPHELVNNLILSGIIGFRSIEADSKYIDKHFQKNIGVSGKEYLIALYVLWGITLKEFAINRKTVLENSPNKEKLEIALYSILDSLSFKVNEPIASSLFDHAKGYSGKARAEAIIARRPLIRVHDDMYFCCGQPYMKIQITRKFLPKALFLSRQDEKTVNSNLSHLIGSRLESLFKELCNDWNPTGGHFDEYFYDRDCMNKSVDRVAFEMHGKNEVALLFQLKAKTLVEASLFGGDFNVLKQDIQSAFSEMIYKSINFIKNAKSLIEKRQHNQATEELTLRILNAKKIVFIGISPDVPAIFTSKPVREIVEEKIRAEVGEETWSWFQKHYERIYWHVLSLHEFEAFLCLPKNKQDFHKTIAAYFLDSRLETEPISESGIPDSYRSYILKKYKNPNEKSQYIKIHPEFKKIFDQFIEEVKDHYLKPEPLI